jgi:hypothetical protein
MASCQPWQGIEAAFIVLPNAASNSPVVPWGRHVRHAASEPAIIDKLAEATDCFADRLG